jgi:hypothetical protein
MVHNQLLGPLDQWLYIMMRCVQGMHKRRRHFTENLQKKQRKIMKAVKNTRHIDSGKGASCHK